MPVSRDVVEHVARLAHIALRPEETEELTEQLSSIVDHIAVLQEVATADVQPAAHVNALEDVMRDDEVRPSWPADAVLANAPRRYQDLFEVQAIFD